MDLRGFGGTTGNGQGWCLQTRQHLLGLHAPNAIRLEYPAHLLLAQQGGLGWGGGEGEQVPQPWLVSRRAQLEDLGIKPVQLVPEPIGTPPELFEQRFFSATELS